MARRARRVGLALAALAPLAAFAQADCACSSREALAASKAGVEFHLKRRLAEASEAYTRALKVAPPRDATASERELILRAAPRVLTVSTDPFPLIDAAAILHPTAPWIAYHLFWEDDIDFPDDNDPCDHEVIWVRLDETRSRAVEHFSYYHGRILRAPPGDIHVQWGKHGSILSKAADAGVEKDQRATYERLSTRGRQSQESPLGKNWPTRFTGSFADYNLYRKPAPLAELLKSKGYLKVSCLNNAVINRHFLRYNFAAKTEWPEELCNGH
jgi:hypothetical protein